MDAELITENIGCVSQFRRYFRERHLDWLSATRGKSFRVGESLARSHAPSGIGVLGIGELALLAPLAHKVRDYRRGLQGIAGEVAVDPLWRHLSGG